MNAAAQPDHASALLAAIVESSDDAIVGKTLTGTITSWNAGAKRIFGYEPDEVLGQSIILLIPDELVHEEAEILGRIRSGQRVEHYQTRRRRKDGKLIDVSITVSPIRDASGAIIGASKIARDITAEKVAAEQREKLLESERAARAEAERLSHLKDEFLATLSHELRTPLNAILGWCALLREPSFRGVDQKQAVETIERNARLQAQIIDDLLDMSRIVSGKIRLDVAPMRVEDAVRSAVDVIRPAAAAKRIRLDCRLDAGTPVVNADTARMQQILWNLLTNAVKFTPAGGTITIEARAVNSQAEITVTDSGVGISADFLPHVFDRFRQADAGTARKFGGLGIGLSIVRNLVELHGGTVRVHSEGTDRGTRFTLCFPALSIAETQAQREDETVRMAALPRLDGRTLMAVDDDPDGRAVLARVLEERGARVFQAATAAEAMELLTTQDIDAVLSDIGMPGVDGYEFIRSVRRLRKPSAADVPAIAVSAYARPEDRVRAVAAGYQSHLAKPYTISGLLAAVGEVLGPEHGGTPPH
jgi:PAS domain S-box-containing protein